MHVIEIVLLTKRIVDKRNLHSRTLFTVAQGSSICSDKWSPVPVRLVAEILGCFVCKHTAHSTCPITSRAISKQPFLMVTWIETHYKTSYLVWKRYQYIRVWLLLSWMWKKCQLKSSVSLIEANKIIELIGVQVGGLTLTDSKLWRAWGSTGKGRELIKIVYRTLSVLFYPLTLHEMGRENQWATTCMLLGEFSVKAGWHESIR